MFPLFTGLSLEPATAGAPAAVSHRVTGYLAMFANKYFINITLKMFTAYPFFSSNKSDKI